MVSIFVFSTAMMGFMALHAHSAAVMFDNESAQFAHSLAFNLVDEINAMSYDSFKEMTTMVSDTLQGDEILKNSKLLGAEFKNSPFNSFGEQSTSDSYRFYRKVAVDTYSKKTQVYTQKGTYLATLYHVDVYVTWPKKGYPDQNCGASFDSSKCNYLQIPLVRSNKDYK